MTATDVRAAAREGPGRRARPDRSTVILGAVVAGAFAVRIASIQHGLPFAYNPDEELHFVPHAAEAADGDWNPRYFENPSALTYLLAVVLEVVLRDHDLTGRLDSDPTAVFTVARVAVAVLGTLLVPLVAWAGSRYFDRSAGLVAAAVVGFAFLPVYYSRQALNDVPTLLPVTVALVGCLRLLERGGWPACLLAGAAVGVAAGTKYLAAPMALVMVLAVALRVLRRRERPGRGMLLLAVAGTASVVGLLLLNPYVVLDLDRFWEQFAGQSSRADTAKLGQDGTAWTYYPVTLLWGLGLLPVALAVVGTGLALRAHRDRALLLVAFPLALYLYMGTQERYFGRWLLPAYPALAILAGYGVVRVSGLLRERIRPGRARAAVLPALACTVLVQPVVDSVRSDVVLAQTDTRTQARAWIHRHADRRIVVEPAVPRGYLDDRFETYPVERPYESYEERLVPGLLDEYRREGWCWVMVNSHQRDRGLAAGLPGARAYYHRLERESRRVAGFSPYRAGADPPAFSYDLGFNWYPWAHERPGPAIELRRLTSCPAAAVPCHRRTRTDSCSR